jgi:hypothetical protein
MLRLPESLSPSPGSLLHDSELQQSLGVTSSLPILNVAILGLEQVPACVGFNATLEERQAVCLVHMFSSPFLA